MKNKKDRRLVVCRDYRNSDKQTLGVFSVERENVLSKKEFLAIMKGVTLELPNVDNMKNISCIPEGTYNCIKYFSLKFKTVCFRVLNVPNRSNISGHPANFYTDLRGCVGFGEGLEDINKDGYKDITNSGKTLKRMMKLLPRKFKLTIYRNLS